MLHNVTLSLLDLYCRTAAANDVRAEADGMAEGWLVGPLVSGCHAHDQENSGRLC